MPIKSERVAPLVPDGSNPPSPATKGYLCSQGVQLARLGMDDVLVPLPVSYKMPLPSANVVVPGANGATVVMAFPLSACARNGPVPGTSQQPQVIKPYPFRGRR